MRDTEGPTCYRGDLHAYCEMASNEPICISRGFNQNSATKIQNSSISLRLSLYSSFYFSFALFSDECENDSEFLLCDSNSGLNREFECDGIVQCPGMNDEHERCWYYDLKYHFDTIFLSYNSAYDSLLHYRMLWRMLAMVILSGHRHIHRTLRMAAL